MNCVPLTGARSASANSAASTGESGEPEVSRRTSTSSVTVACPLPARAQPTQSSTPRRAARTAAGERSANPAAARIAQNVLVSVTVSRLRSWSMLKHNLERDLALLRLNAGAAAVVDHHGLAKAPGHRIAEQPPCCRPRHRPRTGTMELHRFSAPDAAPTARRPGDRNG